MKRRNPPIAYVPTEYLSPPPCVWGNVSENYPEEVAKLLRIHDFVKINERMVLFVAGPSLCCIELIYGFKKGAFRAFIIQKKSKALGEVLGERFKMFLFANFGFAAPTVFDGFAQNKNLEDSFNLYQKYNKKYIPVGFYNEIQKFAASAATAK